MQLGIVKSLTTAIRSIDKALCRGRDGNRRRWIRELLVGHIAA
jgi:hypothetical protein